MKTLKFLKIGIISIVLSSYVISAEMQVEVYKTNDWGSGFCSKVKVSNPNDSWKSWNISFNAEGSITSLWDAEYTQDTDTLVTTASGLGWTKYIKPNGYIKFGYCANKVEETPIPPKEGDLTIVESLNEKWDTGYCNNVDVTNTTNHKIDWEVEFLVAGTVSTAWSANYAQNPESLKLMAHGLEWNNVISANESIRFGYCANNIEDTTPVDDVNDTTENNNTTANVPDTNITNNPLFEEFNIGFGGSYAFPFASTTPDEKIWVSSVNLVLDDNIESNDYYANIKNFDPSAFDALQNSLKNSKFLVYWITEGWNESWYNAAKIQTAMDAGYIPVFNYWYFGDKLSKGMPDSTKQAAYAVDNEKVVTFLNKLNGTKLLIMEPEFNKNVVTNSEASQHEFASIIGSAIDTIKASTSDILFSLAMTDKGSRGLTSTYTGCGYENCSLGDKRSWSEPSIVYNDLLSKLDFISFQQMLAQFSRDPSKAQTWENPIPIAYTADNLGINNLATRIANFSTFLKEKYNKPVFLPYIAIATATWTDNNANGAVDDLEIDYAGWEGEANKVYSDLKLMKSELQASGLFGFAPMGLFDNPKHDFGGYQYFMQNEYHLGIMKSGAVDGIDVATNGDIQSKSNIVSTIFDTP